MEGEAVRQALPASMAACVGLPSLRQAHGLVSNPAIEEGNAI